MMVIGIRCRGGSTAMRDSKVTCGRVPHSVHQSTPGREQLAGATHSLLRKSSQNRTENIKFLRVSYNPSSSPRGQFSPMPSLHVVPLLYPMRLSVYFDQGLSKTAMRPVDSLHQKFRPRHRSPWPLTLGSRRD